MILYVFPSGPLATNAILFAPSESNAGGVIDPSPGSLDKILIEADRRKIKIKNIFLTHSHWDHFADANALKERTGALLYVHALDAPNLIHPGTDGIPLFFQISSVKPDHFVEDGMILNVGALQIEVIHTPGHSPGGVCFYLKEEGLLFSGDTVFRGGMGRTDFVTGSSRQMRDSLKKLAKLPTETKVIPGHGAQTEIGRERSWMLSYPPE